MSKAEIKITDFPYRQPGMEENGDVTIMFKAAAREEKTTFFKAMINKDLWGKVAGSVNEASYYIIKGLPYSSVNSKGIPFISLNCTDVQIVNGVGNWQDKFPGDLPEGAEEVVPIDSVKAPEGIKIGEPAKKKAFTYFRKHNTFEGPVIVRKEDSTVILNHSYYFLAKDLNMGMIPVAYDVRAVNPSKDEKFIGRIPWYLPDEVTTLNTDDIILTEDIHLNVQNFFFNLNLKDIREQGEITVPIAVRPVENGKYSLVIGASRYFASKILGIDTIPAVITNMGHDEFVKERIKKHRNEVSIEMKSGDKKKVKTLLSLITVPESFARTKPRAEKVMDAVNYYKKNGEFDKPIIIRGDKNLLIDGYKRYIAARQLGLESVWTIKR